MSKYTSKVSFLSNEFINNYIKNKQESELVNYDKNIKDILKKEEKHNRLYILDNNIFYTINKTKYKNEDAILICFKLILKDDLYGSSNSSVKTMGLINELHSYLTRIDSTYYFKEIDKIDKDKVNISYIKIIKIIKDNDYY